MTKKSRRIILLVVGIIVLIPVSIYSLIAICFIKAGHLMRDPVEPYSVVRYVPDSDLSMKINHKRVKRYTVSFFDKKNGGRTLGKIRFYLGELHNEIEFSLLLGQRDTVLFNNRRRDFQIKDKPDKVIVKKSGIEVIVCDKSSMIDSLKTNSSRLINVIIYADAKDSILITSTYHNEK